MRKVFPQAPSGNHTLYATGHTHPIKDGAFECDECAAAIDKLNDESPDFKSLGVTTTVEAVEEEITIRVPKKNVRNA